MRRLAQFLAKATLGIPWVLALCVLAMAARADEHTAPHSSSDEEEQIEEVVVRADPASLAARSSQGSVTSVGAASVSLVRATHPNEILSRVPGVWVVRGSGQEHLTGMRSGVLAGAGACGAFLLLEDNIPVRPVGFCNVNGLFELNTEQADSIEVLRGPASAIFGGNALHGVINVRSFMDANAPARLSIDAGPNDFLQFRVDHSSRSSRFKMHSTTTNGYRESTGYAQHKANARTTISFGNWESMHTISATVLDQETGGYVNGFESFKNSQLRRSNPNPEAFRDAISLRAASHWIGEYAEGSLYISPYARRSTMKFLQHFLPGQPTEKNSQSSMGVVSHWTKTRSRHTYTLGAQYEWMSARLLQQQKNATIGSPFLVATRPPGIHYNFDVAAITLAVFGDSIISLGDDDEINGSLRVEQVRYNYDNLHLNGNTRDDRTPCGFGGCLYTRPADRTDSFYNGAVRLGYRRYLGDHTRLRGLIGWGYRPPQTTELYRLQSGQSLADLTSERLRSMEAGVEVVREEVVISVAAYRESNKDLVFRDAEGMNVSDGEILAQGVEVELTWKANTEHTIALAGSLANHEYRFTRTVARGEQINRGAEVDSAPSLQSSVRWSYQPLLQTMLEVEFVHIGSHYLNAANTARYGGHTLAHIRANWIFNASWRGSLRVANALNAKYADRADYAFGNYRYFPGAPRQLFAGIEYAW